MATARPAHYMYFNEIGRRKRKETRHRERTGNSSEGHAVHTN